MVKITPSKAFEKSVKHLDSFQRKKLEKQIQKIIADPFVGKPLKYSRGERVLYIKPFRLVYATRKDEILLLKFEHRKGIYK
jgi:mRNA-degrading endonuclease RelE of RelBE toxin-antitoxin system